VKRIGVLHVSNALVYGGNEEHIRALVKYLPRDRVRVVAALPPGGAFREVLEAEGVTCVESRIRSKFDVKAARRLAQIAKDHAIRIIHTHNRQEDLMGALASRFLPGTDAVTTIHDRINTNQNGERERNPSTMIYNHILRSWMKRIITVSEATRRDVIAEAGLDPRKVTHVTNGMDLARLEPPADRKRSRTALGLAPADKVVGLVARVRGLNIAKKGHRYLIEAAPRVVEHIAGVRFVIVGEDEAARAHLRGLARERGVEERFVFLGLRTDILEVMSAFDVIVLPSLFEGLPRTLMEGMALGLPAVGTRVDGTAELIEEGQSGLLVPARDPAALAEAVVRVLTEPELARRLGAAASRRIRTHYDARAMAEKTARVYDEIVSEA
jgi:glycosyltransferase involved in cell wall biosynthesis